MLQPLPAPLIQVHCLTFFAHIIIDNLIVRFPIKLETNSVHYVAETVRCRCYQRKYWLSTGIKNEQI